MKSLSEILQVSPEDFFAYVSTIRYGYKDRSGKLHFREDADFSDCNYVFSSCEEIVANHCAWCWEIAELTKQYCAHHNIPCQSWFMEYRSTELHQTHTQVFALYKGKWCPTPDNCLGIKLGEHGSDECEASVQWFTDFFIDYLKAVLKGRYDPKNLFVKEYACSFMSGITDEEYLRQIRA